MITASITFPRGRVYEGADGESPGRGEYQGRAGKRWIYRDRWPALLPEVPYTTAMPYGVFRKNADAERMKRIKRLKSAGIQEKHLCDWRFETAKETEIIRWAKRYVEHWKQVREQNLGLLLWGDVGTGKSFVSACIANALLEEAVPVLMTNFSKILNQMGGLYSEERHQYIASFSQYPLLIIDDLGIERSTEYAKEQVYAVLDERYKANLPLITTTNLTIQEIRNPENVMDARIYSRILEMCTPLHVGGGDRRLSVSEKKQEAVKAVLFPKGR